MDDGQKCVICGDKAIGKNYSVFTCISCKSFFKRNAKINKDYNCYYNDNCDINTTNRKFCQKCRLKKCLAVGMRKKLKPMLNSNFSDTSIHGSHKNTIITFDRNMHSNNDSHSIVIENTESNVLQICRPIADYNNNLTESEGLRISELIYATNGLNIWSEKPEIIAVNVGHYEALGAVVNDWELITHKLIHMSTLLTPFTDVCSDDQIALVKYGCVEMSCLRQTPAYDFMNMCLNANSGNDYTHVIDLKLIEESRPIVYYAFRDFLVNFLFLWDFDPIIMDLVTAILLFNPYRSQLKHREVVKYKRWIYFHLLQRYLLLKYRSESEVKSRLRQLVCCLQLLHVLNDKITEDFIERQPKYLGPLFREIFEITNSKPFQL